MRTSTFLLSILLSAASAHAQTATLSVSQAISEAEDSNPDIQRMKATAERLSWGKLEAMSAYIPHLSADYDHYFNVKYMHEIVNFQGSAVDFPAGFPQDTIDVNATWTIFDGLRGYHNIRAAELNNEAANLDLSHAKFKLEASIRTKFYQALAAQKLAEVAAQNVKTLEDHLRIASLTEKSGYGTRFDVLRIKANLEESQAEQGAAENNVEIARRDLAEVMGTPDDNRSLEGEIPVLEKNVIDHNITVDIQDREDIQAQTRREKASSELSSASKGYWVPSVSLFAQTQYYKFGDFDPGISPNSGYRNDYNFGIALKWDFFDGGNNYAKQQQALAASRESASQLRSDLNKVNRDFDLWKRRLYYNIDLYHARLRALEESQESVRLSTAGVKAGSRTHTEVLDAELDLFRSRAGLIRAQADAIDALGQLELATGRRLWNTK